MKTIASFFSLLVLFGGTAFGVPLNGGWTADGAPVTLPHCWNVEDGTDGPTDPKANNHDSVAGTGYARRKVVYRRDLPPATPGLKRYLRVHAASIHTVVKVDGREIGRHAGAFTAFTFALPPDGKARAARSSGRASGVRDLCPNHHGTLGHSSRHFAPKVTPHKTEPPRFRRNAAALLGRGLCRGGRSLPIAAIGRSSNRSPGGSSCCASRIR